MTGRPSALRPPSPTVVDPLTGIAAYVVEAEMDRGDPAVFIVVARTADIRAYGFPQGVAGEGSGAGLTYAQAYGAAVGECVERYAFSVVHPEDLVFGSWRALAAAGLNPIPPLHWALFDSSQQAGLPFAPFDEETPLGWVEADSLSRRQPCLVPACLVYMPYTLPFADRGEVTIAPAVSTGGACARSRAEALLKGLCELVERDAFMIVWRNRLPCPRVRIDADSPLHDLFMRVFVRPGLEYALFHTTLDLGIPSFLGVLIDRREGPPTVIVGGAAHPDPAQAVLKTLVETVQGLKWKDTQRGATYPIEPGYRNVRSFDDRMKLYALNSAMLRAFDFLFHTENEVPLSCIPSLDTGDVRRNLQACVQRLTAHGLEVLAVDITPVDVAACGYHVVKVLVPELETMEGDHLLPFLGGRRWREVPQRLFGLTPTLADINPDPHPYP